MIFASIQTHTPHLLVLSNISIRHTNEIIIRKNAIIQ